ncbi:MAG TPA: hypothetical protein VFS10_11195 [Pyrinomonadaceae bacterium]|nr:hypothetical protein [Pyrinomonadaceae bacterium]
MKFKRTRLSLFVIMLMLSAQLSAAPPTARAARNTDTPKTAAQANHGQHGQHDQHDQHMGIPDSRCRRRCSNTYRQCIRRGKNRKACARQLRNCQRRCPQ